jgi:hypothetical protein
MDTRTLRKKINSAFEPFAPASPETYVDCAAVRGNWDVTLELGYRIVNSEEHTCQLFSGHRGSGKSTELLRSLSEYLEEEGFKVVYFAVDREGQDLEPGDVQYADILLSCVRHILEALPPEPSGNNPLMVWLNHNWEWIKNFLPTKMSPEEVKAEVNLGFGKLITTLRTVPDRRREIRRQVNEKTDSLQKALNEFIAQAKSRLPDQFQNGIVLIVDNLDRIPHTEDTERKACREIYVNRSTLMRGLNCHVIYTVPVDMIYSSIGAELRDSYDSSLVLPMLMVRYPDGKLNHEGINALRQLVTRRIKTVDPSLVQNLDNSRPDSLSLATFANPDILDQLCLMSGGRVRVLMHLIQEALKYHQGDFPIDEDAVLRAIQELGIRYSNEVLESQWPLLVRIAIQSKTAENESEYFKLMRQGHLLEYRYFSEGRIKAWRDVHPLLVNTDKFHEALQNLGGSY